MQTEYVCSHSWVCFTLFNSISLSSACILMGSCLYIKFPILFIYYGYAFVSLDHILDAF